MAYELVYTSVPRGLKPGSSGFCTVAYTNGLAGNIALKLEGMSGYKPYFPHYDENAKKNPVSFTHYISEFSGETLHFVSRTGFYGLDYTKRSNKLSHHCVLKKSEAGELKAGPAAICLLEDTFITEWDMPPQLFPQQKKFPIPVADMQKAVNWEYFTGDAGWAGTLAQHFLNNPDKQAYIIFDPLRHPNMLYLVYEALLLLPEEKRWEVSFNTYFTGLPSGMNCSWRFCVPNSGAAEEARRLPGSLLIDLTAPMGPAGNGELENAARTGELPKPPPPKPKTSVNLPPSPPAQTAAAFSRTSPKPASFKPSRVPVENNSSSGKTTVLILSGALFLVVVIACLAAFFILGGTAPSLAKDDKNPKTQETFTAKNNGGNGRDENDHVKKGPVKKGPVKKGKKDGKVKKVSPSAQPGFAAGNSPRDNAPNSAPSGKTSKPASKSPQNGDTQTKPKQSKPGSGRKVVWTECVEIGKALSKKGGKYTLKNVLGPKETLKSCWLNGEKKPIEYKDGKFEVTEVTGINPRKIFILSARCKDGNIELEVKELKKKFTIISFTTDKGTIYLRYTPDKTSWPSQKTEGVIETNNAKETVTFVYKHTDFDKKSGLVRYFTNPDFSRYLYSGKTLIGEFDDSYTIVYTKETPIKKREKEALKKLENKKIREIVEETLKKQKKGPTLEKGLEAYKKRNEGSQNKKSAKYLGQNESFWETVSKLEKELDKEAGDLPLNTLSILMPAAKKFAGEEKTIRQRMTELDSEIKEAEQKDQAVLEGPFIIKYKKDGKERILKYVKKQEVR